MRFFIFTDIPVWVCPLVWALEARDAEVHVGDQPEAIRPGDAVVNRTSTRVARKEPEQAAAMRTSLQRWEEELRLVINGANCLELGFSKWAQVEVMRQSGVAAPRTELAQAGRRQIPDQAVLLKPPAGGFGRGIRRLEAGEPVPHDIKGSGLDGWVEQVGIVGLGIGEDRIHQGEMKKGGEEDAAAGAVEERGRNHADGEASIQRRSKSSPA